MASKRHTQTDDHYFGKLSPDKSKDTWPKKNEADKKKQTPSDKQISGN